MKENEGRFSWLSLDLVKDYFDVTNEYVLRKLLIILFPFTVKGEEGWRRNRMSSFDMSQGDNPNSDSTPRSDLQAPDLYIPLMSFVTSVFLIGCIQGFVKEQ